MTESTGAGRVARLEGEMDELRSEFKELTKLAVSQAAMIALLSALLASKGVLTREEAIMVTCAGQEANSYERLSPEQVQSWIKKHLESM